jgi:hypothetical protein
MSTPEVVSPVIHLNGTSKDRLLESLSDAYHALSIAYEKLRECAPNGRDYYPQPGLMEKAVEQHRQRQQHIQDVLTSIELECAAIDTSSEPTSP